MKGFFNRLLTIDLSHRRYAVTPLSDELLEKTLGGKGLATHLLLQLNPAGVNPFDPRNHLIFSLGPATDTAVWGGCRYGVYTKSPQTGFYSESYSGGTAAEYMSRTGYDAVVIHGASSEPVWLEVDDNGVYFHDAQKRWGEETYTTEKKVKHWIKHHRVSAKGCGVLTIGPAGENGIVFSVIENDLWRSAGRTGSGAVMGSKKIKAIAFWGHRKRSVADPDGLRRLSKQFMQTYKGHAGVKAYKTMGTPMMVDLMSEANSFPTRYWRQGRAPHQKSINAQALHERCEVIPHACRKCFMACGRLSTVKKGRHAGLRVEGPEYETIYAFGGLCMVDNIEDIIYLNDLCDKLGMDTISAGNLAALAIEATRQNKINSDAAYGNTKAIALILSQIAHREGIGKVLAKGIRFAATTWGLEEQAIHVKGLEPAGYDPRVLKGMGLSYGTSPRGACHLRTTFYKPELTRMIDPDQIKDKAVMLVDWENRLIIFDTLILCRFYRDFYQWKELAQMFSILTGLQWTKELLLIVANEISDNTRRFNLREGLKWEDDKLPKRFYKEALPETGGKITESEMESLLLDYYRARKWEEKQLVG